jgi:hypothetical protein
MYFEVRNWLVMMKLASTCLNSDMGVVWGLQCLHPNTIKPSYSAAKFVLPIPIFLAYLVSLDVDVVPIKIHQFLLGE